MSTTVPTPQDKRLLLQDLTTRTTAFNSSPLDLGEAFAPSGTGQPVSALVAVVNRANSSGQTYLFTLQESDDGASYSAAGAGTSILGVGVAVVKAVISKRFVRLALTVTGTTPSILYKAWLNPVR